MRIFDGEEGLQIFEFGGGVKVPRLAQEALWVVGEAWLEAQKQWVCVGEGGDEDGSKLSIKGSAPLLFFLKMRQCMHFPTE